uniref:Thioredoxin domain-containing protein n=1 Tax=Rhizophora mucronata TaxID=61149 RepID=A0A2P2KBC9_RHIMU
MALVSVFLVFLGALSSVGFPSVSASTCPKESYFFPYNLQFQCPLSISANPVLKVDGNFLDKFLTSMQGNACTSVLFYASWCPFSSSMRPKFELLSSMFPQIEHLAVEQSSALPSIFSRYGIRGLPSILIVDQTSNVQYHGPQNLQSLVNFYEKTTGLKPVLHLTNDEARNFGCHQESILQPWDGSPLDQIMKRELCLVFATLFLCLRLLLFVSPKLLSHLKAFWDSCVPHFNLGIFGETTQLFGRILHMVDVRRIWTKLRLCKARNFHERAKNCRVWASSLTSVSLGESSSSA